MSTESQPPKEPAGQTSAPPPAAPQTPQSQPPSGGALSQEEKNSRLWAMLCHLAALAGFLTWGGLYWFGPVQGVGFFVGPLIIWLIKRHEFPFVDEQGKEAVNFQLTMLIAFIILGALTFHMIGIGLWQLWSLLWYALVIFDVVMAIMAGVKANDGVHYRYPFAVRLIR
jgi:hypothetical protein